MPLSERTPLTPVEPWFSQLIQPTYGDSSLNIPGSPSKSPERQRPTPLDNDGAIRDRVKLLPQILVLRDRPGSRLRPVSLVNHESPSLSLSPRPPMVARRKATDELCPPGALHTPTGGQMDLAHGLTRGPRSYRHLGRRTGPACTEADRPVCDYVPNRPGECECGRESLFWAA